MIKYSCLILALILMSCDKRGRERFVEKALMNLKESNLDENQFRLIICLGERFSVINISENLVLEKRVEFYVDRKMAIKTDSIINVEMDTLQVSGEDVLTKYYNETILLELKSSKKRGRRDLGIQSFVIEFVLDGDLKYYSYQYPQKEILPLFQMFVDYPLNPPTSPNRE